ncbi:unspecific monooxygenase [Dictyocaulus viviparus]|uniref:Unspecific monooxygenase n=1 Tax=Dictyocaulus viviparus TaxID=29172 RepID=A0A0D8XUG3_DICVI|nr:unspecific monooxygenase [Dictyocaulus viviparus]
MGLFAVALVIAALTWISNFLYKRIKYVLKQIAVFQGPVALPLIGNLTQFHFKPEEFFEQAQGLAYMLRNGEDRICRIWFGPIPFVLLYGPKECEAVLGSNKLLNKPIQYSFLSPWIGEGLLISKPDKWRSRRKLLTPTFHYEILKDFVEVYNRHGQTLLEKFLKNADRGQYEDIFHTVTLCTLDVICEAALGICIDAQKKPHSPYLEAVFRMKVIVQQRQVKPQYYSQLIFDLFGDGKEQQQCVKILHEFTGNTLSLQIMVVQRQVFVLHTVNGLGRRRMAFLDLMLDMHSKGELSMEGIQEEVDTFTFEGHDTTSASINWFLHLMGAHPHIQEKVQREVDEVLGETDRTPTYEDLGSLKYLEACVKETLRLYPSVPLIARQVVEDVKIRDHLLPAGTGVAVIPSMVHRDPNYWDDPEVFRPERFINGEIKHPYAYIPFSAGSRNCIGQRFALMEEKCILALLMRHLRVRSLLRTDQMRVAQELIIRPLYGNRLKFERRSYGDYSHCTA